MTSPPDTRTPGGGNRTGGKSAINDSDFFKLSFSDQMAEIQAIIDSMRHCPWFKGFGEPLKSKGVSK